MSVLFSGRRLLPSVVEAVRRDPALTQHLCSTSLDFDPARDTFMLRETGQTLTELISSVVSQQIGESIDL